MSGETLPDGRFAPGAFPGALAFAAAMRERSLELPDIAKALGIGHENLERVLEGSMPLPSPAAVSYRQLISLLALVGEPLEIALLYTWQRADAAVRSSSKVPTPKVNDR